MKNNIYFLIRLFLISLLFFLLFPLLAFTQSLAPIPDVGPIHCVANCGSGNTTTGGGIFLSPLIILMKWASPKKTSATSAFSILVNSISGLPGHFIQGGLEVGNMGQLFLSAFLGGLIGSYIGSNKLTSLMLVRTLAVVLLIAAFKLILKH